MARRRLKGPRNWNCNFRRWVDCQYLPHGFYSLLPTSLACMAFWVTLVQDGCDYARLEGRNVELITGSDVLPYLEVGFSQYRAPLFFPTSGEWTMVYTEECLDYPIDQDVDVLWKMARWLSFFSSVIGGGVALFLWFTTCFTFSVRTWRFCAVEAGLAALLQAGSFLFLLSGICSANGSSCSLYFGSRMDITAIVLWLLTSAAMFAHYPDLKLRVFTDEEFNKEITKGTFGANNEDILRPKNFSVLYTGSQSNRFPAQNNEEGEHYQDINRLVHNEWPITSRSNRYNDGNYDQSLCNKGEESLFGKDEDSVSSREQSIYSKGAFGGQSVYSQSVGTTGDAQSYHSTAYEDQSYFHQQSTAHGETPLKGIYL